MTRPLFQALALILCLSAAATAFSQRPDPKSPKPKTVIVDDESCGCELVYIDGIQTIERDGLFGFKRDDGSLICEAKYKFVDKFHGDYCIVYSDYDKCGLLHRDGRLILPVQFSAIDYPTDGMMRVLKDNLYGFFDTTGRQRVDFKYRTASGFSEGLAVVCFDFDSDYLAYGYIDHDDHMVIEPQFEFAYPFEEGYAIAKKYDRFAMIDHQGKEHIPFKYIELTPMHDGTFWAVDAATSNAALFDKHFKQLTPFIYEKVTDYTDGFYVVMRDNKTTFVNLKGKECCGWYDQVSGFFDGYSWVRVGNKYGIIDRKGNTVLPIEYDNSGYRSMEYLYSEGLFLIEKEGRYGYADTRGRIVIPIQYESAYECTEGLMPVQRDGMWGYIDRQGNDAIEFVFQLASPFVWGRAEVAVNGEVYKINPDGDCVKNCKTFPKIWHR
jgi:hypothetical protein